MATTPGPSRAFASATETFTFETALKSSGTSWLGIGRGIGNPIAIWSEVCRGPARSQRSLLFSMGPADPAGGLLAPRAGDFLVPRPRDRAVVV